jgi:hypothetical protein
LNGRVAKQLRKAASQIVRENNIREDDYSVETVERGHTQMRRLNHRRKNIIARLTTRDGLTPDIAEKMVPAVSPTAQFLVCGGHRRVYKLLKLGYKIGKVRV